MEQIQGESARDSRTVARAMARAAADWLSSLDDDRQSLAWWGAPGGEHEGERRLWFYTPTDHGGLPLNAQVDWQQRRAMQLVASGLSPQGHSLVSTIMGTENILDRVEGFSVDFDTRRGRDPSRYYLRVFGDPLGDGPWGWRFGGHHISLNYLIVGGEIRATTPRFLGLDPAVSALPGGSTLDPLGAFQSSGRDLVTALTPDQQRAALLHDRPPADIVMGNRSSIGEGGTVMKLPDIFRRRPGDADLIERLRVGGDARDESFGYGDHDHEAVAVTVQPKGVSAAGFSESQKALLDRLVWTYHDALPSELIPKWDLDELYFAWAGPVGHGEPNYYRVQGGDLLIEWDNTARDANHAHGVIRHLTNDFGGDVLGAHRGAWHMPETHHQHHDHL